MKKKLMMQALIFFTACMGMLSGCRKDPVLPVITTTDITNITTTTAATGGLVTSDGGSDVSSRGVCWSTFPFPTIDNTKTTDGAGTGSFSSIISGLSENTTYYVRAYATNRAGTGYGNEISFTTIDIVVPASNIE